MFNSCAAICNVQSVTNSPKLHVMNATLLCMHSAATMICLIQNSPGTKTSIQLHPSTFGGFSCRSINKLMRALNGNTAPTESHLRISAFNTNGLTVLGRWHLLLDRDFDICMISETHCTAFHQKSLDYDERVFGHMGCTCSIPISQWSHVHCQKAFLLGCSSHAIR